MAQFLNDTFTDTAGVALTSHVGETGATWTYNTSAYASSNIVITDANRARNNYSSNVSLAYASGTPITADYSVTANVYPRGTRTGFAGVAARINISANTFYYAIYSESAGAWQLWKNVAGTATKMGTDFTQTLTSDVEYKLTLSIVGTGLTLLVNDVSRVTATDSSITAAGRAGVVFFSPTTSTNTNGFHLSDVRADDPVTSVTAVASLVSANATSISVSVTASNGTSPYTYQWYRSTIANFTPGGGNILSGATSTTLTDSSSLVAGTIYWYKCVVTDSGTQSVTTNPIAAQLWSATLRLGFIGDSITNGFGTTLRPGTIAAEYLERLAGLRVCTATNQGVNGSRSADWVSGSGNLVTAKSAFASASVTHVVITLGTNDTSTSVSNATYLSNMTSLVNDLVAAGYKVILNNSPGYNPNQTGGYDSAAVDRLAGYATQLDSLVNGTTVLRGDKFALSYFSGFVSELVSDGVHFTDTGNANLAFLWAYAIYFAINPVSSGGVRFLRPMNGGFSS